MPVSAGISSFGLWMHDVINGTAVHINIRISKTLPSIESTADALLHPTRSNGIRHTSNGTRHASNGTSTIRLFVRATVE